MFLYQASRHASPSGYYSNRRRYSQSSIRSDFDLALLKKGIKGRYEILGHGQHPFQVAMRNVGLEEEFYGHIVLIEDSKNAVWFKLNYDNIGKNQTKYLGSWRDLNSQDLAPHIDRYNELLKEEAKNQDSSSRIRAQFYYLNSLTDPKEPLDEILQGVQVAAINLNSQLTRAKVAIETKIRNVQQQKKDLQDEVRQYLRDHKG